MCRPTEGSRTLADAPEQGQRRLRNTADSLAPGMRPQEHSEGCVEDMIDGQPVEPACNRLLLVPSRAYQAGGRVARSIPALANAALISMVNIDDVRTTSIAATIRRQRP
jgi:hypothetical protein